MSSQPSVSVNALLHLKIIRGRSLRNTDKFTLSKIDPYILIAYGENVSSSKATQNGGSNCDFDWSVTFPFDPISTDGGTMKITVMDKDFGQDDIVGTTRLNHDQIRSAEGKGNSYDGSLALSYCSSLTTQQKKKGFLDVVFWWERQEPIERFPNPVLKCVTNENRRVGYLKSLVTGETLKPFRVYQMSLWFVDAIFQGDYSHWNEKYPAAQTIYGPHAQSLAIRQTLHLEYTSLYSHEKKHSFYEVCLIHGLCDLFQMLAKKRHRFTYVITPKKKMHFSRTSTNTAQDFLSKHALHNNAREEVVYAGEFFFDTESDRYLRTGEPALVIDNNSGTFAPVKDKLPELKVLLELNFGTDLPIFTLDREDPLLKHLFRVNDIE